MGKLADLVVLSADPLSAEEEALKAIQVQLTMVGGRIAHSDGSMVDRDAAWPSFPSEG